MFGFGIVEVFFLVVVIGGSTIWLHPDLLTRSGYFGCLTFKKIGMAALRIIVWVILFALAMPRGSQPLTAEEARIFLGTMVGAAFLTWILFRLPQVLRGIVRSSQKGQRE